MIPREECQSRASLAEHQAQRLQRLLAEVHGANAFYTGKLRQAGIDVATLQLPAELERLPLTTKAELVSDQAAHPPWGTALTYPLDRYTRYCQTSSTTGTPLRWIDTNESWQWMLDCWKAVYRGARVGPGDRVFFPFSFGPFLGFWAGFDAGHQVGLQVIPGGGMSSEVRLAMIDATRPTVVCCTPTYALRLADVAAETAPGRLRDAGVRVVIVAGEPGGSIASTRRRIEEAWGARVIDHHGLTEVGPISFECWESPGHLHLNESEYICEVLDPRSGLPVPDGERGELVVTNLGRAAHPVIRYRTGDVVIRRSNPCACGRTYARLEGGVLSRVDDMVNVRGVNVFPAAIEAVVREFTEVAEFRAVVSRQDALASLAIQIEVRGGDGRLVASRVSSSLRQAFGLTVPVTIVEQGSLPRFEVKGRRFVIERSASDDLHET
ncbi:MAG: phenylacetate--CoA ligase family protein [Vicinamibacterales bacterium]